jgi:hypothetical protein
MFWCMWTPYLSLNELKSFLCIIMILWAPLLVFMIGEGWATIRLFFEIDGLTWIGLDWIGLDWIYFISYSILYIFWRYFIICSRRRDIIIYILRFTHRTSEWVLPSRVYPIKYIKLYFIYSIVLCYIYRFVPYTCTWYNGINQTYG